MLVHIMPTVISITVSLLIHYYCIVLAINASTLTTPYPICHAVLSRCDVVIVVVVVVVVVVVAVVIGIADTRRQTTEGTNAVYRTL
jgi:hypothetical protein